MRVLVVASLLWLALQLWFALPFPWALDAGKPNVTEQRSLHLGFALFLAFLMLRSTGRISRPMDWGLALLGAFAGSYIFLFYDALAARPKEPTALDILVSGVGLLILIEVVRRAFGRVAAFIILALSLAALIGSAPITWHGVSRFLKGLWLTTEGVFGLALGISTSLAFLSLVLGAVADRLGFAKKLPHRLIGWLNRRRASHKIPLVVPRAFDGHVAKWIMAFVVFWQLRFTLIPSFHGPALIWGTKLLIDFALILALVAVSLSVSFRIFAKESRGGEITKNDPYGRLLVWWGCLLVCLGSAVFLSLASELALWPLSAWLKPRTSPGLRIVGLLAAAALFALVLWVRPAKSEAAGGGIPGALSFWLPWAIFAWFGFVERTSPVQAAFWASLASLMMMGIASAFGATRANDRGVRRSPFAASLSLAVVDAARATVYVATFAAFWGVLIYYFVALPG